MKNVIVKWRGMEFTLAFSPGLRHADIAKAMQTMGAETVSAGFVKLTLEQEPFGTSESLGMGPRPQDRKVIERDLAWPDQ